MSSPETGARAFVGAFDALRPAPGASLALPPGAVDLWAVRVDRVGASDWRVLSDDERARAERLIIERKRVQQVAARAALRRLLGAYLGRAASDIRFSYGEHERPELQGGELSFNLSHSYDWALVAIAKAGRVGVDVEFATRERAFEAVAERFFCPVERAYLRGLPAPDVASAFYRAWTRKEAYLKAWGTGLSFASTRFCIDYAPGGPGRVVSTEMPGDDPVRWHFVDVQVESGYPAAMCTDFVPTRLRAYRPVWDDAP